MEVTVASLVLLLIFSVCGAALEAMGDVVCTQFDWKIITTITGVLVLRMVLVAVMEAAKVTIF